MLHLSFKGRDRQKPISHGTKTETRTRRMVAHMKSFGGKVAMGGYGTVSSNGYKAKGLRNKRKSTWARERKDLQMLKDIRARELLQQDNDFDNFDE
jgi:hypothetical protein